MNDLRRKNGLKILLFGLAVLILLMAFFGVKVYICNNRSLLPYFVTMLTAFYHFAMRVIVGETVTCWFHRHPVHGTAKWFQERKFELRFYRLLQVKKWKKYIITAKPKQFDLKQRSPAELYFYMLQAEVVHTLIIPLSFLPLFLSIPYGKPVIFTVTSLLAALIDLSFIVVQRYNRPRVEKLLKK